MPLSGREEALGAGRRGPQEQELPLRPAHPGVPGTVRGDHHRDAVQVPARAEDTYDGHLRAAGHAEQAFEAPPARPSTCPTTTTQTTSAAATRASPSPSPKENRFRGGFREMDPPEQRYYRQSLNAYLSRPPSSAWVPVADESVRASLDEKIESGRDRLRRRSREHRTRRPDSGDHGRSSQEVDALLRAAHAGVYTPAELPASRRGIGARR